MGEETWRDVSCPLLVKSHSTLEGSSGVESPVPAGLHLPHPLVLTALAVGDGGGRELTRHEEVWLGRGTVSRKGQRGSHGEQQMQSPEVGRAHPGSDGAAAVRPVGGMESWGRVP